MVGIEHMMLNKVSMLNLLVASCSGTRILDRVASMLGVDHAKLAEFLDANAPAAEEEPAAEEDAPAE